MLIEVMLLCILLLLVWALKALIDIRTLTKTRIQLLARAWELCDTNYPAFSRARIDEALARHEKWTKEAEEEQARVNSHPDWHPENKPFVPSPGLEKKMLEAVVARNFSDEALMHYEFMIEQNLRVWRGIITIAEARASLEALPTLSPIGCWTPVDDLLADWKKRLATDGSEYERTRTLHSDYSRLRRTFEGEVLDEFEEWQKRRYRCIPWKIYRRNRQSGEEV